MTEKEWDSLLKIQTTGRDDSNADQYRYPYEPTPYPVLERLAGSGLIGKRNLLLDYGCGKGRVDFFLAWQLRCRCIGVDYDTRMIRTAMVNRYKAVSGIRTLTFPPDPAASPHAKARCDAARYSFFAFRKER